MVADFAQKGWARFAFDPDVAHWARHAAGAARRAVDDPALAHWHQCQGTWFVGVDALDNDAAGAIDGSGPLTGAALDFITDYIGPVPPLHKAQLSVMYPGYPKPRAGENDAAFRYRLNRDAAHVDGLIAVGPHKMRKVQEPHQFILGLPLNDAPADAAPLVVWKGSHLIMRDAFRDALAGHPQDQLHDVDITAAYQAARRTVFDTCARIKLPAQPGEAIVLHRHILHGVAPWVAATTASPDGRMIAYFRPQMAGGVAAWLEQHL
ncbi:hypothetical protein C1J05_08290 [Sulfitobacter sp. JL08]|uniref:hypothetical protein n=1 Tax=Sulfitobacter sp. JL08 TaxID=2070369 RepID=UPI000E0BE0BB|nr:hypothetical protein [Sulfitobacter sp. JL08]AXI54490.1 hypothetical protein C1J05_08290 [Sulfitobacter sp. JL08]